MENFNKIESDILNKVEEAKDRVSIDSIKIEVFGKKGVITALFKKIGSLENNKQKDNDSKHN